MPFPCTFAFECMILVAGKLVLGVHELWKNNVRGVWQSIPILNELLDYLEALCSTVEVENVGSTVLFKDSILSILSDN